jgi:phage shock protein PspC (stress-responsive transcriptional regulator)
MDRLYRSIDDRVLAGVAGGMAELWDIDPSIVRIAWVILTPFTAGFTILVYLVMAIVVPEEPVGGMAQGAGPTAPGGPRSTDVPPVGPSPAGQPAAGQPPGAIGGPSATQPGWLPGSAAWRDQRRAEKARVRAERAQWRAERRASRAGQPDTSAVVGGVVLVIIGAAALATQVIPGFDWGRAWPIGLIIVGALLLVRSAWPGGSRS